eukprot:SAG22_NODE_299_length_12768_cov_11.369426_6_plen_58_part_00
MRGHLSGPGVCVCVCKHADVVWSETSAGQVWCRALGVLQLRAGGNRVCEAGWVKYAR